MFAIDEAQFLPDLLEFCTTAADVDRKHVVVAGLDGDFKRQRFGQVCLFFYAISWSLGREFTPACTQSVAISNVLDKHMRGWLVGRYWILCPSPTA